MGREGGEKEGEEAGWEIRAERRDPTTVQGDIFWQVHQVSANTFQVEWK